MSDPLAVLYNEGYWRVNKVSPMYNLQYNEIKLKQYSTKVRQTLASDVVGSSGSQFAVIFENLPLLKYSHEDPNGLQITVTSKDSGNSNNKNVYVAVFLSWGTFTEIDDETTHLPYMLECGDRKIGVAVKNTMQTLFDCIITQFNFTKVEMLDFTFNFVENDTSRNIDPFVLKYRTPGVNFKDKTSFTFEIGHIRSIWNWVKNSSGLDDDREKRSYAYQCLQNQIFYKIYDLDVTVLDLCEVALPKAEIKTCGVVKMKTPEVINSMFTVLNEISQ